ncbi:MAG: coniferyl aldehyde dehydrogenase [Pseudomonadota bacterium]
MADPSSHIPDLDALLAAQRRAFDADPYPAAARRREHLTALERALRAHAEAIARAIDSDFGGRSVHETRLLELFPSLEAVRHARRHLRRWMKPERRPVSIWFLPGANRVLRQPLGVAGIIVPWNYPLYLAIGPLAGALAAGNRVMIKMSEFTPRTGAAVAAMLRDAFPDHHVAVVNGGVEAAQAFSRLPFDHLLFTGSTGVGRAVMRAAADSLTPVTLELGGKSPAIVAPDFPVATAAERILFGKLVNAGQTCVAPDYVLLPGGAMDAFLAAARELVARRYPRLGDNPDYTAIVNERQYARLAGYLAEARTSGARVEELNPAAETLDPAARKLVPALVLDPPAHLKLLQEEIFGPILPLIPYQRYDDALAWVRARPRPLALYLFDHDRERVEHALTRTHAGGVTVNDTLLHVGQEDLPFGGVGPSGMGAYHGRAGFETFSKAKGVFRRRRISGSDWLQPPFGKWVDRLVRLMLR